MGNIVVGEKIDMSKDVSDWLAGGGLMRGRIDMDNEWKTADLKMVKCSNNENYWNNGLLIGKLDGKYLLKMDSDIICEYSYIKPIKPLESIRKSLRS